MPTRELRSLIGSRSPRLCDDCQKRAKLRAQKAVANCGVGGFGAKLRPKDMRSKKFAPDSCVETSLRRAKKFHSRKSSAPDS